MNNLSRNIICSAVVLAFSGAAFAAQPDADRVILKFKPGSRSSVENAVDAAGGRVHLKISGMDAMAVSVPAAALNGLRNNSNIEYVEQDALRYPMAQTVPYGVTMVQADQAVGADADGRGIKVCVIDSGIKADHEDFAGVSMAGYASPGQAWDVDNCGHGTHVAGTINAADNNLGVVGVSPGKVSLHIIKVFDGTSCRWSYSSTLIDAANRCKDAGAKIISMSLGGGQPSTTESNGFANLYSQGLLSIAAAGNAGNTTMLYPASYNSVVSVAAVDSNRALASFSQRNDQVEIAAPGVSVLSTYLNGYAYLSGTSMATPHVAGVAALVWSADPTATNQEVRDAMNSTAFDLGTEGRDNSFGFGLVQAFEAVDALTGGGGDTNTPPVASFTYSCSNLACSFNGTGSNDSDGNIVSYSWSFGASGSTASYTFPASGTYSVTLTVTDDDGATGNSTRSVTVSDGVVTSPSSLTVTKSSRGKNYTYRLNWSGGASTVDVFRDNNMVASAIGNTGTYSQTLKNVSTATYKVCNAGSTNACSNSVSK